jgi:hypothetical protein
MGLSALRGERKSGALQGVVKAGHAAQAPPARGHIDAGIRRHYAAGVDFRQQAVNQRRRTGLTQHVLARTGGLAGQPRFGTLGAGSSVFRPERWLSGRKRGFAELAREKQPVFPGSNLCGGCASQACFPGSNATRSASQWDGAAAGPGKIALGREDRMQAQESFKHDPQVQVLLATDAAGEGINLQRAHLMVNYDLPWNPNRLEQRFRPRLSRRTRNHRERSIIGIVPGDRPTGVVGYLLRRDMPTRPWQSTGDGTPGHGADVACVSRSNSRSIVGDLPTARF